MCVVYKYCLNVSCQSLYFIATPVRCNFKETNDHLSKQQQSRVCFTRYQLNKIVVDTEAGPHRNRTVVFLGSSRGTILKFLVMPNQDNTVTEDNVFLEELEGFNPEK